MSNIFNVNESNLIFLFIIFFLKSLAKSCLLYIRNGWSLIVVDQLTFSWPHPYLFKSTKYKYSVFCKKVNSSLRYYILIGVIRYTLQASTFQMAVLLQYNLSESWSVSQLSDSTRIKTDFLLQVLQILIKAKLLACDDNVTELHSSSIVSIFSGYKK